MKTDNELKAIIAEVCGWKWYCENVSIPKDVDLHWWVNVKEPTLTRWPPDYLNSLDAIQQAVLAQDEEFQWDWAAKLIQSHPSTHWWKLTARDHSLCFVEAWEQRKAGKCS